MDHNITPTLQTLSNLDEEVINTPFVYEALNPELQEFRLLRLLPSTDFSSPIQCEIFHSSLNEPPSYEALSYAWGNPADTIAIQLAKYSSDQACHDASTPTYTSHQVTVSLALALQYLRLPSDIRVVWADALCINQQDNDEKSHQVRQMRDIYLRVSQVVVWLGDNAYEQTKQYLAASSIRQVAYSLLVTQPLYLAFMHKLYSTGWWTRLWIVQEVMHQRPVTVYIGSYQITLLDLCKHLRAFILVRQASFTFSALSPASDPPNTPASYARNLHAKAHIFNLPMILLSVDERQGLDMLLLDCLDAFRSHECADDRDKVFAVLGLTRYRHGDEIMVDYNLTKRDVYTSAMKQILISRSSGALLCVQSPDRLITSLNFPSWVPDWTMQQDHFSKNTAMAGFSTCCPGAPPEFTDIRHPPFRPDTLILSGLHVGIVQTVSWIELSEDAAILATKFTRMKIFTYSRDISVTSQISQTPLLATTNISEVVSFDGMLTQSWGPPMTEPGDIIIISPMSLIPLILRKVSNGAFLLVGGCFLIDNKLEKCTYTNVNIADDPGFSLIMRGSA